MNCGSHLSHSRLLMHMHKSYNMHWCTNLRIGCLSILYISRIQSCRIHDNVKQLY